MHICSCGAFKMTSAEVTSLIKLDSSKCREECCITGSGGGGGGGGGGGIDNGGDGQLSYHYLSVVSITTLDYTYIIYNINLLDSRDHLNIIIFLLSSWLISLISHLSSPRCVIAASLISSLQPGWQTEMF